MASVGTDLHRTVGLVMIVRNEQSTLPRLARSLAGQIDYWTIVDTGSTDSTCAVVTDVLAGVPGRLLHDRWRGFAASREVALHAAQGATDWMLLLDGDHTVQGEINREELEPGLDALLVEERHHGTMRSLVPRLVASGPAWRWRGSTHEYLALDGREARSALARSFWVQHHADGGTRAEKFFRDLDLLEHDWAEAPGDPRTAFYMARTLEDLHLYSQAARWYEIRSQLRAGEEHFYALYRLGVCLLRLGRADEAIQTLWKAWWDRPWRTEPLLVLAEHYRKSGRWDEAWMACQLAFENCDARPGGTQHTERAERIDFDASAPQWKVAYQALLCFPQAGEAARASELAAYLLHRRDVPTEVRDTVSRFASQLGWPEAS